MTDPSLLHVGLLPPPPKSEVSGRMGQRVLVREGERPSEGSGSLPDGIGGPFSYPFSPDARFGGGIPTYSEPPEMNM